MTGKNTQKPHILQQLLRRPFRRGRQGQAELVPGPRLPGDHVPDVQEGQRQGAHRRLVPHRAKAPPERHCHQRPHQELLPAVGAGKCKAGLFISKTICVQSPLIDRHATESAYYSYLLNTIPWVIIRTGVGIPSLGFYYYPWFSLFPTLGYYSALGFLFFPPLATIQP